MKQILEFAHKVRKWVAFDGLLHIEMSALLVVILAAFLPVPGAVMLTMFAGIAKEFYDLWTKGGNPTWEHDIWCDVIGIVAGCVILIPYMELASWS